MRGAIRDEMALSVAPAILAFSVAAGTVAGLVLHVTRVVRSRSVGRYFACWSLAGIAGALVAALPWLMADPKVVVLVAVLGGGVGGPAVGAWHARRRVRGY